MILTKSNPISHTYFLALLVAALPASAQQITLSDGDFVDSDWTTFNQTTGSASSTTQTLLSGGNPDAYRSTAHTISGDSTFLYQIYVGSNSTHNPSCDGPITSIDYSVDTKGEPSTGNRAHITALLQDGNYYRTNSFEYPANSTWASFDPADTTEADWWEISGAPGSNPPDFSETGGPIQFGFADAISGGTGTFYSDVDNWEMIINHAPPPTWAVGGSVTGLTGSVTLQNNGSDDLTLSADGSFAFPVELNCGGGYQVTVASQPTGQTCTVTNDTGAIGDPNPSDIGTVVVNCVDTPVPAPSATPVPALPFWAMSLLGFLAGLVGLRSLRKGS